MRQSSNGRLDIPNSSNKTSLDKKPNEALRHARKDRGLTQAQLAEAIGVDEKTVRRWEAGERKPQPTFVEALCRVLSKSQDQLGLIPSEESQHIQENSNEKVSISSPAYVHKSFPLRPWMVLASIFSVFIIFTLLVFSTHANKQITNDNANNSSTYKSKVSLSTPSLLHQNERGCAMDSNEAGYLKVYTKQEVLCFSGVGTFKFPVALENVRKVEVGRYPAHWTYLRIDNTYHLTPMSGKPNLYWCGKVIRDYQASLIHLVEITIASSPEEIQCAYGVSS